MAVNNVEIIFNDFAEKGAIEGSELAILKTAELIVAQAIDLAQEDTGQLKNSISYVTTTNDGGFNDGSGGEPAPESARISLKPKKLEGYAGTNLDHGVYNEFGTRYMSANPFLRPAGELIKGGELDSVVTRFNREAMKKEFSRRKKERLS
jgi:HK97 gp10 family phage protein